MYVLLTIIVLIHTSTYTTAVDCGPLPNLENGRVDTSLGTIFQKVATYSCDVGHTLSGSVTRRCAENEQWIPDAPYCLSEYVEV